MIDSRGPAHAECLSFARRKGKIAREKEPFVWSWFAPECYVVTMYVIVMIYLHTPWRSVL